MKTDTTRLKTISNHAKAIGKSRTWVVKLIAAGKLKEIVIDGVHFVEVEK
jgi:hypothetical protein